MWTETVTFILQRDWDWQLTENECRLILIWFLKTEKLAVDQHWVKKKKKTKNLEFLFFATYASLYHERSHRALQQHYEGKSSGVIWLEVLSVPPPSMGNVSFVTMGTAPALKASRTLLDAFSPEKRTQWLFIMWRSGPGLRTVWAAGFNVTTTRSLSLSYILLQPHAQFMTAERPAHKAEILVNI